MKNMKIVIAGGGTGGHLFPAIALADELKKMSKGAVISFVGSQRGLESRVVPACGYNFETLSVEGIKGRSVVRKLRAVIQAGFATLAAIKLLRRLRPDGVVGTGGYCSGPLVLAAKILGIKTAILEQNAIPGLTNRMLGKFADRIYISFEEAEDYFPLRRVVLAGNPVREDILNVKRHGRMRRSGKFTLFVFGGSQGATAVNAAWLDAIEYLTDIWGELRVVHQTGKDGFKFAQEAYKRKGLNVELHSFIDDMASVYGSCDLIVCRAGATSIAEITALGLPSILIPYPFASDSHQDANARSLAKKGAAVVIMQDELTGSVLACAIKRFFENPFELKKMRDAVVAVARPDASARIVRDYMQLLAG